MRDSIASVFFRNCVCLYFCEIHMFFSVFLFFFPFSSSCKLRKFAYAAQIRHVSRAPLVATHCAGSCHFLLWQQMFEYGINWPPDMMYILYKDNDGFRERQ